MTDRTAALDGADARRGSDRAGEADHAGREPRPRGAGGHERAARAPASRAAVVGVTGPPGAGKSTLVDRLIGALRAAGQRVGVVAVDPSSPFSGGAVLGDRIRMQAPLPRRGRVHSQPQRARQRRRPGARDARRRPPARAPSARRRVIVETVGVGQNEFDVMRLADTVVVVLVPEAGDTIQAMKAGLLEIADVFVVNKADRDGAARMKAELELDAAAAPERRLAGPRAAHASPREGSGIDEFVAAIERHRGYLAESGDGAARAAAATARGVRRRLARRARPPGRSRRCATAPSAALLERGRARRASIPTRRCKRVLGDRRVFEAVLGEARTRRAMSGARTFVIGDIHGCVDEVDRLLDATAARRAATPSASSATTSTAVPRRVGSSSD